MLNKYFFICLTAFCVPAAVDAQVDTTKSYFAIQLTAGENYEKGKPILSQKLKEHGRYMKKIFDEGKMVMAGPFAGNEGALIILYVDSEITATDIMNGDPAIKTKIFEGKLYRWQLFFKR